MSFVLKIIVKNLSEKVLKSTEMCSFFLTFQFLKYLLGKKVTILLYKKGLQIMEQMIYCKSLHFRHVWFSNLKLKTITASMSEKFTAQKSTRILTTWLLPNPLMVV